MIVAGRVARGWLSKVTRSPVMAGLVPAIPIRKSAALHDIGTTGTRPVMMAGRLLVLYVREPEEPAQQASSQNDARARRIRLLAGLPEPLHQQAQIRL
jgi:hypothetical protein